MSKQQRKITNGSGKTITMMIDPANTTRNIYTEVRWTLTVTQWRRIVQESDNTAWTNEKGATILFDCPPFAADCRYPGRS